jgi:hypothetical protein
MTFGVVQLATRIKTLYPLRSTLYRIRNTSYLYLLPFHSTPLPEITL